MKNILLLFLTVALVQSSNAQTYFFYDFEDLPSISEDWNFEDVDGDGLGWVIAWGAWYPDGEQGASSSSYDLIMDIQAETIDNWMITANPIDLSDATGTLTLSFRVFQAEDFNPSNPYTVYVGTSPNINELINSPYSFSEELTAPSPNFEWQERSFDVSGLAGESEVYIALRHHDEPPHGPQDILGFSIDKIKLGGAAEIDIAMSGITTPIVVASPGNQIISGLVENVGFAPINAFDITWTYDGNSYTDSFSELVDIGGGTAEFAHSTPLNIELNEIKEIEVCVSIPNDSDLSNNCQNFVISSLQDAPKKYVVAVKQTGTWCGACPAATVQLENLEDTYEQFIGIAVHLGDPMDFIDYTPVQEYLPSYVPAVTADHVLLDEQYSSIEEMYLDRVQMLPPAEVIVEAFENGNNIDVKVSGNFVVDLAGDLRFAVVALENHVTGTGPEYAQANNFSGDSNYPFYGSQPNPVPAEVMEYNHTARALGDGKVLGTEGSLPGSISAGESHSYTYSIPINEEWNLENMYFVGMLVNGGSGEIYNAGETSDLMITNVENIVPKFKTSIYPNPATEQVVVELEFEETKEVGVKLYNLMGQLLYTQAIQEVNNGAFNTQFDVSNLPSAMYIIEVNVDGQIHTEKLQVY